MVAIIAYLFLKKILGSLNSGVITCMNNFFFSFLLLLDVFFYECVFFFFVFECNMLVVVVYILHDNCNCTGKKLCNWKY